ncbi:TPA: hypothetical protein N0F65_001827 [Lagenidium giganteum]|uniref:PCI domain-containing protein n=1 Tax=Lagenidium giganteum TaxID=4803 RepID=A0AAV2Z6M0_9STRA|nr:TPA: hypothetical protein N0F65_001827 [Lagenidium giganteum]
MALEDGGASSLEQFTLLAKNARGRACVVLIQQVLSNKKLFVFRELLDMPNVAALQHTEDSGYYELLRIFAFGTYQNYLAKRDSLPALVPAQVQKLRKLTVVSLAHANKMVPYTTIMKALDVSSVREMEDVVIDSIYSGLMQGKLNQKSQCFAVKYAIGRDTEDTDIDVMIAKLSKWKLESATICDHIDTILSGAEALAEEERNREEAVKAKMSARASDRSKGSNSMGGNPRFTDDLGFADAYSARRR